MADDGSAQTGAVWPLPKFYFEVRFGDADPVPFQEVSGLNADNEVIEYRQGGSPTFSPVKLPGLAKMDNVILKKGLLPNNHAVRDWFTEIQMNTIKRQTVTIALLDEKGASKMVWKLSNAFPVKVTGTDLRSGGNETAVEEVELAYEAITVERG